MDINHVKEGEITIVTVNGRLDATTALFADKAIKKILNRNCLRMIFDFSALEFLSSSGLKVILGAAKELRRKKGQLVICSQSNLVNVIFEVCDFNSVVPIARSVKSGITQLVIDPA